MLNKFNFKNFLSYKNNELYVHDFKLSSLIEETPCVILSLDRIKENAFILQNLFAKSSVDVELYYAIKASYFKEIISLIKDLNLGVEVISSLELEIVRKLSFESQDIIFNGIGRDSKLLYENIKSGVNVNLDSLSELRSLIEIKQKDEELNIGFRIHPEDVDGNFVKEDSKLGIHNSEISTFIDLCNKNNINIIGIHFHLFSNQKYIKKYNPVFDYIFNLIFQFKLDKLKYVDLGGGFAPRSLFKSDLELKEFVNNILSFFEGKNLKLFFELGRYLVSDSMICVSEIKAMKKKVSNWAILDIGTNYLIPAPGASFRILPINILDEKKEIEYKFVDGICSPAGHISDEVFSFELNEKDLVCVINVGAYTNVMSELFVYTNPSHIIIDKSNILRKIKKKNFDQVIDYYDWN